MLPAPRGIYPGTRTADPHPWSSPDPDDPYVHPCANFDMYRVDNWVLDLAPGERQRLQNVLDGAAVFHKRMYEAHQALDQELRDRMAVVAGVGFKTLFRLSYARRFFGLWERMDKVLDRIDGDLHREGDSRVPLASACLENVREIRYVRGVHGSLPMMPQVYDDVFRWLNGEPMVLPDNPAGALRKHLAEAPRSEFPHLDGSVTASGTQDDPGLWNTVAPDTARLAALRDDLDQDKIPEFSRVHLL